MIVFLTILIFVLSQECNQPVVSYAKDDNAVICFRLEGVLSARGDESSATSKQCACVGSKVDEFSLVSLEGTNDARTNTQQIFQYNSDKTTQVFIEIGDKVSAEGTLARHQSGDSKYLNSVMTVIIYLDDGKVDKIMWDDFCDSSACDCIDNAQGTTKMCGLSDQDCANTSNNCDIKAYVTWFGTDKDGKYLTSAGQRLSRFVKTSGAQDTIKAAYNSGQNVDFGAITGGR